MVGVVTLVVARLDCERAEVGRVSVRGTLFPTEASGISADIVACTSCPRFLVEKDTVTSMSFGALSEPGRVDLCAKGGSVID